MPAKKRSTASRRAAALKGMRSKKRKTGLSARSKTPARRKTFRKVSRRRSGLGEFITTLEAKTGAMNVMRGAGGGLIAYGLDSVYPAKMDSKMRIFWTFVGAFVIATVGRSPYVGSGMSGVAAYQLLQEMGLLNENGYADPIEQLPMVLDASGNAMMLNDHNDATGGLYLDDNGYYLNEDGAFYLDENGEFLQESDYQVSYAPDFGGDWEHEWQQT